MYGRFELVLSLINHQIVLLLSSFFKNTNATNSEKVLGILSGVRPKNLLEKSSTKTNPDMYEFVEPSLRVAIIFKARRFNKQRMKMPRCDGRQMESAKENSKIFRIKPEFLACNQVLLKC